MAEEKKQADTEKKAESAKSKTAKASKEKTSKKASKIAKGKKKPKKRIVLEGKAFIQASFNNTIITITDLNGEVLSWSSAGANGFKGAKKATPYAAQVSAENAATKAKLYGLEKVNVYVKGVGAGREQAVRGLQAGGIDISSITDVTPIAHNGCRPRKSRRV